MPTEITDPEEFTRLAENASECRVKRLEDIVKLKLRTRRQLYTIKLETGKAEELLKKLSCQIVEV